MILVTGATGLTGSALVERLSAQNVPVRVLVRNADTTSLTNILRSVSLGCTEQSLLDVTHAITQQRVNFDSAETGSGTYDTIRAAIIQDVSKRVGATSAFRS
jgi:nucleoside-diphosphate-sugar epimerase